MSESKSEPPGTPAPAWIALVQPFAYLAAILLGLTFMQYVLKIDLRKISFNAFGVTAELVNSLEEKQEAAGSAAGKKLDDLNGRIALLESRFPATGTVAGSLSSPDKQVAPVVDAAALRTATDLAPLFQKLPNRRSPLFDREGYIFLGNAKEGAIEGSNLRISGGQISRAADLRVGSTYTTSANLTLRGAFPGDSKDYFLGVPSLGVVTSGLSVILLESVREAKRSQDLTQLWVKVRVAE